MPPTLNSGLLKYHGDEILGIEPSATQYIYPRVGLIGEGERLPELSHWHVNITKVSHVGTIQTFELRTVLI